MGDVAEVVDGFAESDTAARFDGMPAVYVDVGRVGDRRLAAADDLEDHQAHRLGEGVVAGVAARQQPGVESDLQDVDLIREVPLSDAKFLEEVADTGRTLARQGERGRRNSSPVGNNPAPRLS